MQFNNIAILVKKKIIVIDLNNKTLIITHLTEILLNYF